MDVRKIFSGLNIIAVGLILLANTLGYLPWNVWLNILSLWPLLLVAAGLDVLGKALDAGWLRAVSGLVILGGLAYGALVMTSTAATLPIALTGNVKGVPYEQSVVRRGTRQATLSLSEGASDVTIGDASEGLLVSMKGTSPEPVPVLTETRPSNFLTAITIAKPSGVAPIMGGSTMAVGLDPGTVWNSISLSTGASSVNADLSRIPVGKLTLSTGATSVTTTLSALQNTRVEVSAGASAVDFRVPSNAGVRVVSDGALVSADLPGFRRESGTGIGETVWTYINLKEAVRATITIDVSMGAGSLKVSTYAPEAGTSTVF